eukprot:Lankesteria_metandrocarpae@DN1910_c0_g1_i1.p1
MAAATVTSMPAGTYQPMTAADGRVYTGVEGMQSPPNYGALHQQSGFVSTHPEASPQRFVVSQQTPVQSLAGVGGAAPAPSVLYNVAGNVTSPTGVSYTPGMLSSSAVPGTMFPNASTLMGGATTVPRTVTPTSTILPGGGVPYTSQYQQTGTQYQPGQYQPAAGQYQPAAGQYQPAA